MCLVFSLGEVSHLNSSIAHNWRVGKYQFELGCSIKNLKIALGKLGCHELVLRKAKFLFCMSLWVGGLYGWAKTGPHAAPRPWEDGVGRGQKTLLLAILGDTWKYLVILGSTWSYLGTEDSTLDNIWQILAILGDRSLYSLKYLILPSIWLSLWINDSTLGNTLQLRILLKQNTALHSTVCVCVCVYRNDISHFSHI